VQTRARTSLGIGAAVLLVAVNLRTPLTAVPPILDAVRSDLGLSLSATGLLTALPLLCFGACGLLAPPLARRWSGDTVLLWCLALMAAGDLVRLAPQVGALFAGTLALGVAIAIANILVPAVIKRNHERPGPMIGLYAMMLNVGAALGAGLTVPLRATFGGSWRAALAFWAVPVVPAAVVWWRVARSARRQAIEAPAPRMVSISLWRTPLAWRLTGLMGIQSTIFYSCLAWIPDILRDNGVSSRDAGLLLSIVMLVGLPTSLGMSILAGRTDDQRRLIASAGALWVAALLGLLLATTFAPALWMALMGAAQGCCISLALALVVLRSADDAVAASLSGMSQSAGYLLASGGPVAVGLLHDLSGGWAVPIAGLLACVVALLICGIPAGRPGGVVGG
jgi:CP family cyanate transporter-like MFS transporter